MLCYILCTVYTSACMGPCVWPVDMVGAWFRQCTRPGGLSLRYTGGKKCPPGGWVGWWVVVCPGYTGEVAFCCVSVVLCTMIVADGNLELGVEMLLVKLIFSYHVWGGCVG